MPQTTMMMMMMKTQRAKTTDAGSGGGGGGSGVCSGLLTLRTRRKGRARSRVWALANTLARHVCLHVAVYALWDVTEHQTRSHTHTHIHVI